MTSSVSVAYVELPASLAAAMRSGRISSLLRDSLMIELERVWGDIGVIAITAAKLRRAGDLAEQMRLRAYDGVHLAALQKAGKPGQLTFACWDDELRDVARTLGYQLLPF